MWTFRPAILHAGSIAWLPRPITVCRVHDSWDFLKLKAPLREGDFVSGVSRDGAEITLEGQCGSQDGSLTLSETSMLATLQALREALNTADPSGFELALYHNSATDEFHYFRSCATVRFDWDLSSPRIYAYALSIHAADPSLLTGDPR